MNKTKITIYCIFATFLITLSGCSTLDQKQARPVIGLLQQTHLISHETADHLTQFLDIGSLYASGGSFGTAGLLALALRKRKG